MSAYDKVFKLAESQGITVPELIKFLASPTGYTLSKALSAIETQANLPQGILSIVQNPASAATNYVQTQAQNAVYDQNNPSRIENIISELQGANPDKPNYVGPQEEASPVSQMNFDNLSKILGQQSTPSNVPEQPIQQAFSPVVNNETPATAVEFLKSIMTPAQETNVSTVQQAIPESLQVAEPNNNFDFGNTPTYGGGGKGLEMFDMAEYARGGFIHRGIR